MHGSRPLSVTEDKVLESPIVANRKALRTEEFQTRSLIYLYYSFSRKRTSIYALIVLYTSISYGIDTTALYAIDIVA